MFKKPTHTTTKAVKLNLIDLAGSERVKKTLGAVRQIEGAHINKSLLALGKCIAGLSKL